MKRKMTSLLLAALLVMGGTCLAHAQEPNVSAELVQEKIDRIGYVVPNSDWQIAEAREAYQSLEPAEQKTVNNLDVLIAAEERLKEIPKLPEGNASSGNKLAKAANPCVSRVCGFFVRY